MLLSTRYNFLFLANPKCASSTVEEEWRHYSQLSILSTRLGKHLSCKEVQRRLAFFLQRAERQFESFFCFGIVRDPVDKAVSWFNYRARNAESLPTKSSAMRDFAALVEARVAKIHAKAGTNGGQRKFFSDRNGQLAADYLIALPNISAELPRLRKALGITHVSAPTVIRKNVSPTLIAVSDLSDELANALREIHLADIELYNMALNGHFGSPESAVARKFASGKDRCASE